MCEVPLTDMLRYTELYAGASWVEEYGDPADPEMREYLAQFSPYHQLSGSLHYPPAFITTSLADDRVHPAHALKFYAKLAAAQPDTTLLSFVLILFIYKLTSIRNRRPHRQRHARTKRGRTGVPAGVFAPNHRFIKKQPAL